MSYLVLARKYRPKTFDEVIGQETTAQTLKNAVESGRVAHAYLFTGPRGVGKTTMARILAKALNCKKGPTPAPCNKCEICKSIDTGDDVDVIEIDGASNRGIDQIRALRDNARYAAARSRHKIYVIDEVHALTKDAFNALLKTLEEPPPHVKFIFATTEPQKVIETIRSRCQRFDFRRIPATSIAQHLAGLCEQEKIKVAGGVLDAIARAAHGGMRDAESLLDQLIALAGGEITLKDLEELTGAVSQKTLFEVIRALADHDPRKAVELADDTLARGAADDELMQQFIECFRELLIARVAGPDTPLIDRGEEDRKVLGELAQKFTTDALMFLVQMFAEAKDRAKRSSQSRIVLELALIKAADVHELRPLDEVLARLRSLEAGGARGGGAGGSRPDAPATRRAADAPNASATARTGKSPQAASQAERPEEAGPRPAATGDLWTDALALIERAKPPLAHFLGEATLRPSGEPGADGSYILELDRVAFEQAKANLELIQSAIGEITGKVCRVELRTPAAESTGTAPQPASQPAAAQPKGEHVKKAMGIFGARVIATRETRPRSAPHEKAE